MGRNLLCASAFALMFFAAMPANAYRAYGGQDCGQWLNQSSASGRSWLAGFISGLNAVFNGFSAAVEPGKDALAKTNSAQQVYAWMDNYCRANPLKTVDEGATELYFELMKK